MTAPKNKLTQEDIDLISTVYSRRAAYLKWLVKSLTLGVVAGLSLGWLSSGLFNSLWLNPVTWLSALWVGSIPTALKTRQGASTVKAVLLAPVAFKKELSLQSTENRKGQALLAEHMKKYDE